MRAMRPAALTGVSRLRPSRCLALYASSGVLSTGGRWRLTEAGARGTTLGEELWVLVGEVRAVLGVDRLGDRNELERRLDVAAGLDAPAGERDGDVLLALEVPVGGLRGHRHPDLR